MHGLGNDFVVVNGLGSARALEITPQIARGICDRHFGIGADQLLWVRPPSDLRTANARMVIFNPDGSIAEMCGNGIRAVTLYLFGPNGILRNSVAPVAAPETVSEPRSEYLIETLAGLKTVWLRGDRVQVDMGAPTLGGGFSEINGEHLQLSDEDFPRKLRQWLRQQEVRFFEVSMGNPHAVIFVDALDDVVLEALGAAIEVHPRFPKRTNVEFAQIIDEHTIEVLVWERGTGVTLACGTGACAVAAAAIATGRVKGPVQVRLPGGALSIEWSGELSSSGARNSILMEGPAQEVYRGRIDMKVFAGSV
ncbi:MAG: diaminopimelate epimerase [Bdellovibrionales bacterium GWB1_52_6]|nr:MAG: diaminopimelate epimerase [Bdellovibrionales bacterium GWB1_52_6]OFZ03165.1 MAG: diaminopimelate epimerase [Bdellovibrionales bacterium GWA1_52_35]HCM38342.1 diaminopimelate epimerase [Bdellovibrionales bacterium]